MKKKVSILCSNLANNALGRSHLLATLLKDEFTVEIYGPLYSQQQIWEPLRNDTSVPITPYTISKPPESYREIRSLYEKIDGDIIYANKTYFFSVGLGFLKKIKSKAPLVVDIDDWDLGFTLYRFRNICLKNVPKYCFRWFAQLPQFYKSDRVASLFFYETLSRFADDITVSNTFLKRRFGGHLIPHIRDTSVLSPEKHNPQQLREKLKIPHDKTIISFIGTPREFKGIEDLIDAVLLIDNPNLALMIVGLDSKSHYTEILQSKAAPLKKQGRLITFGNQPLDKLPEFLAVSDIIAIPQRKCIATVGQIPMKVFDAMAMEKPIVATAVSDLPDILKGCGWIAEPNNPKSLSSRIQFMLDHPEDMVKKKKKALIKCANEYGFKLYQERLTKIFSNQLEVL